MMSASIYCSFVVVLLLGLVNAQDTCADWKPIPHNCTCDDNTEYDSHSVRCTHSDFPSFPTDLPNLSELTIQNSNFPFIDKVPYTNIRALHLEKNHIRFIHDLAFEHLAHCRQMSLANNQITGIGPASFGGLRTLTMLTLNDNPLYEIKDRTFTGQLMPHLEIIRLSSCHLYAIAHTSFDDLIHLQRLELDNNHLTSISSFINSTGFQNLNILELSHNQLTELPIFFTSEYLAELMVSHNRLTALRTSSLRHLTRLLVLKADNNLISSIDKDMFTHMTSLKTLDLSGNRLVTLDSSMFPWKKLASVSLYGNPWHCNCTTAWIRTNDVVKDSNIDQSIFCHSPHSEEGMGLYLIHDDVFQCYAPIQHTINRVGIAFGCLITVILVIVAGFVLYKLHWKRRVSRGGKWPESEINTSYRRVLEPELS